MSLTLYRRYTGGKEKESIFSLMRAKGREGKALQSPGGRTADAKPEAVEPEVEPVPVAVRGAAEPRGGVPRASPKYTQISLLRG